MKETEDDRNVAELAKQLSLFNNTRLEQFKKYIDKEKKLLETKSIIINCLLGISLAIIFFYSFICESFWTLILFATCTFISYIARLSNEAFIKGAELLQALHSHEIRRRMEDEQARKNFSDSGL